MRRPGLACLLVLLSACGVSAGGDDDGNDAGPRPDAYIPPPTIQQDYSGTYTVEGTWDLSSPFGGDGLGGFVADLMIDKAIELAGVPSALEDQARDLIAGQVRQSIVDYVNGVIPPELYTSGPTMMALAQILSAVAVDGSLSLSALADPDGFTGTDTVSGLAITHQGNTIAVSMPELLEGAVSVSTTFGGGATGADTIAIAQHELELRFGVLVAIAARDALGVDVYALADQAMATIDCPGLVATITGGATSYSITVAGQSFSVSAASLEAECESRKLDLAMYALGMISPDAGVRLGGPARLADGADGVTDTVTSEAGYGGAITALPIPVEPQVSAAFVGSR